MEQDVLKTMLKSMEIKAMEAKKIGDDICKLLDNSDDVLFDTLNGLQDCEINSEEAFTKIKYLLSE